MNRKDKPAFALDQTLTAYGIRKLPFPIEEADDFYFATPALAKSSDALRNLVEYSDLILVVSGVEGAGKTAFLNQFLLAADTRWRIARIESRAAASIDRLVEALLAGFGVRGRGEDAPGDEALLRTFLTEVHAGGNIALVVIDDAHLLPQICIEFLVALAEERGRIDLRLLLSTEPGRLGFPTNDPKRVHVVVLKPFDLQQCGDYIHTRLSYAGLIGDSPFDARVVEGICQDSGGLPGAIHPLALHTLLASTDAPRPRRRGMPGPRTLAYAAAALTAIVAAAWLLRPEPVREPLVAGGSAPGNNLRGRIEGLPARAPEPATTAEGDVAAESPAPDPFVGSVTPKVSPEDSSAGTMDPPPAPRMDENTVSVRPAVAVTSQAKAPDIAPGNEATVRLARNATPENGATGKTSPADDVPHDLAWLRTQDPAHYVIQLVGSRDKAAIGRFLESHRLGAMGAWFTTSHESKPWYVVVYGMYPDRATAKAAIETLPEALRSGSPWPRSVASVVESAR